MNTNRVVRASISLRAAEIVLAALLEEKASPQALLMARLDLVRARDAWTRILDAELHPERRPGFRVQATS